MPRPTSVSVKGMHDTTSSFEKGARKTERSHEENQERAYIAASRRADRSLEARVQSARMASDIHKKRTGKSFRITEDIVLKEEMYEEEDDDLPRSYRLLSASMQTNSTETNLRLETYLSNKVAMSQMLASTNDEWRGNAINKLFAASFPNALPTTTTTTPTTPTCPSFQPISSQSVTYQQPSPEEFSPTACPNTSAPPMSYAASFSGAVTSSSPPPPQRPSSSLLQQRHSVGSIPWPSPPSKSSSSTSKRKSRASESGVKKRRNSSKSSVPLTKTKSLDHLSTTHTTPILDNAVSPHSLCEPSPAANNDSAFTTELPTEARMMFDEATDSAALDHTLASLDPGCLDWLMAPDVFMEGASLPRTDPMSFPRADPMLGAHDEFMTDVHGNMAEESVAARCIVPNSQNAFDGSMWGNFINDSMWSSDQ